MTRKPTGREGRDKDRRPRGSRGCAGAAVLGLLGLYFGYLFFYVGGSGVSIVAGILILAFSAYLAWNHLRHGG